MSAGPSAEKDAPVWETEWAVAGRLDGDEPWMVFPGDHCPNRENAVWLAEQRNEWTDFDGEWVAVSRLVSQWVEARVTAPGGGGA